MTRDFSWVSFRWPPAEIPQMEKSAGTRKGGMAVPENRAGKTGNQATQPPAHAAFRFARARDDRQTEIAEDYVELIDELTTRFGHVRAVDIARELGVSHVTVFKALARLRRDGLVAALPKRAIILTEIGRALAQRARQRHQILRQFLHAIGVDPETAEADAEGMEHHASDATLRALQRLTVRLMAEKRIPQE